MSIIRSFGEAELLIGLIEAFGGERPESNGPGELLWALIQAIEGFNPGGSISLIENSDGTVTISGGSGPTVTISRSAVTGDVSIPLGSNASTLNGTVAVEYLIREQTLDQMANPAGPVNLAGQRIVNVVPQSTTDGATALNQQLASTFYEPSPEQSYSIGSSTPAAIDTTHLTLPFTAISAKTLIELQAYTGFFSNGAQNEIIWMLFTHGTTTQVGYSASAYSSTTDTESPMAHVYIRMNTVAGTAYQVDWAWATTGGTAILNASGTTGVASSTLGPAVMRAFAS